MPELPPFITEQWATVYFEVLFSVLVFAVGIPFLGLQLIMQEDVRHVVTYKTWKIRVWAVLVFVLLFSNLLFIWIIHPLTETQKASESNSLAANAKAEHAPAAPPATDDRTSPPGQQVSTIANPASTTAAPTEETADHWPWYQSVTAGAIITFVPLAALSFAYWLPLNYTRKRVIRQFEKDLISSISRDRRPNLDVLIKITYLGEHGNPGFEKNLVLDSFKRIAEVLQDPKTGYKGWELADIIRSINPILQNSEKPGDDENYKVSAKLLHAIWGRVSESASPKDAMLAASALKQLGLSAVRSKSEETALLYLIEGASCDEAVVFELGVEAVRLIRFNIATDALNKLEAMAFSKEKEAREREEATHSLLGLLAHFFAAGESSRRKAERSLAVSAEGFVPSLEDCMKSAIDYHFSRADFETSDKLLGMARTLAAAKLSPSATIFPAARPPSVAT